MATQEITISELELADEVLADMTLPVDTATETRAVTLKQLRAWLGSALPVGSIFASIGRLDDERFTLLDGKTISRTGTYEAFCNKVVEKVQAGTWKACTEEEFNLELSETGQCGKFVVSNDYVRIPKLGNSLCSGVIDGTIPVVGNGMTLGLTEGTHNVGLYHDTISGVIARQDRYGTDVGSSADTTATLDAYKSVGVTTDPTKSGIEAKINSVEVFYYMVISTEGQTANVEIDINKVYEDLNLKANSDLSNVASVAQSFKEASVGWGMPDYSARIQISSFPYTVTFKGWLIGQTSQVTENFIYVNDFVVAHAYNNYSQVQIPVDVGDVITKTGSAYIHICPTKGVN